MCDNQKYRDLEEEVLRLKKENNDLLQNNIQTKHLLKSSIESFRGTIALSIDENYRYLYFNDAHKKVMKSVYNADITIGLNILDCISNGDDRSKAKANYDKALKGNAHVKTEEYGEELRFYYESSFNPILNDNNKIIGVTAVAMNITDKINADNALLESELKHQALMANINDVIGIVDSNGLLTYKSPNTERLFGWDPKELIGKSAFGNVHPEDLVALDKEIQSFFSQKNAKGTYEYRYKHKDGIYRWIELSATNRIDDPVINGILINYHDITDRKKTEHILKENERLYKSLFENLSNSSSLYEVVLNDQGEPCDYRFLAVNPIFEASVGRTGDSLIGKTLLDEFPATEQLWLDTFKEVCITGKSGMVESYTDVLDMHFEIIAYIPQPGQMAMIGSDITERKKGEISLLENQKTLKSQNEEYLTLNEELNERNTEYASLNSEYKDQNKALQEAIKKAQESDRLKNEFLSNMSHEVRTPMNGIIGFSQLLNLPGLEDEMRDSYIDTIQQSSNQLLGIIDNIIEISKLGTKQVKVVSKLVNLNTMLSELHAVFSIHASKNNIDLIVKNDWLDQDSNILLDEIKLYKILSNLLENALKFTSKGFVEFGYVYAKDENINALKFYVKDSGIGISKQEQERIFVKFSQVKSDLLPQFGGLGLGLSIAKENTELMGGNIILESERGKGSIFTITIPFDRK